MRLKYIGYAGEVLGLFVYVYRISTTDEGANPYYKGRSSVLSILV